MLCEPRRTDIIQHQRATTASVKEGCKRFPVPIMLKRISLHTIRVLTQFKKPILVLLAEGRPLQSVMITLCLYLTRRKKNVKLYNILLFPLHLHLSGIRNARRNLGTS